MFLRNSKKASHSDISSQPDKELILRYRKDRDTELIGVLFSRYVHLVYGLTLKYVRNEDQAKDLAMEIFEKLPDDLLKHKVENFKSWLYTVSKNHCLMALRRQKTDEHAREGFKQEFETDFMENGDPLHQDSIDVNNREQRIREAISTLNAEQRKCVELVYLQEKSYNEVMEMTGYSYKEVKSYVQNAKRNLKIRLEDTIGREE